MSSLYIHSVLDFPPLFTKSQITPYIHFACAHLEDVIERHGSITTATTKPHQHQPTTTALHTTMDGSTPTRKEAKCVTCSGVYFSRIKECSKFSKKRRKETAADQRLVNCMYCNTNHELREMITQEGQRRSKCLRSKMRRETQDRYSHSPCKAIEFSNARETIQYLEETEFQKGHQL